LRDPLCWPNIGPLRRGANWESEGNAAPISETPTTLGTPLQALYPPASTIPREPHVVERRAVSAATPPRSHSPLSGQRPRYLRTCSPGGPVVVNPLGPATGLVFPPRTNPASAPVGGRLAGARATLPCTQNIWLDDAVPTVPRSDTVGRDKLPDPCCQGGGGAGWVGACKAIWKDRLPRPVFVLQGHYGFSDPCSGPRLPAAD